MKEFLMMLFLPSNNGYLVTVGLVSGRIAIVLSLVIIALVVSTKIRRR